MPNRVAESSCASGTLVEHCLTQSSNLSPLGLILATILLVRVRRIVVLESIFNEARLSQSSTSATQSTSQTKQKSVHATRVSEAPK